MKPITITQSITDRQDNSLKIFFKEVSCIPMITPEREIELAQEIKKGNQSAINELVKSNLRFVISVAKQYQNKGLPLVDLIQSGVEGLIEASKKWDSTRGFKFISYAVWWIRQSIIQALSSECRTVRIPMNQIAYISKISKVSEKLEKELERIPSVEEISNESDLSIDKINSSLSSANKSISLDSPFKSDETDCLLDVISNDEKSDEDLLKDNISNKIDAVLHKLTNREEDVVRLYFGINVSSMTLEEIASRFGIGAERARQILNEGIKKMKDKYKDLLRELL